MNAYKDIKAFALVRWMVSGYLSDELSSLYPRREILIHANVSRVSPTDVIFFLLACSGLV